MANIAKIKINTNGQWQNLEDLIKAKKPLFQFTLFEEYILQSFGINILTISDIQPSEDDEGFEVINREKFTYTKLTENEKVWVKNLYNSELNISE